MHVYYTYFGKGEQKTAEQYICTFDSSQKKNSKTAKHKRNQTAKNKHKKESKSIPI